MLGLLLGHLHGDTSFSSGKRKSYTYYNTEILLIQEMQHLLNKYFKHSFNVNSLINQVGVKQYRLRIERNADMKRIKKFYKFNPLKLNVKNKKLFLRAIFDDDGSINKVYTIYYCTTKKERSVLIINLLNSLGYPCVLWEGYIKTKTPCSDKPYHVKLYQIRLHHQLNNRFYKEIGFLHPKKKERLEYYINCMKKNKFRKITVPKKSKLFLPENYSLL